jgi:hypothetical protein
VLGGGLWSAMAGKILPYVILFMLVLGISDTVAPLRQSSWVRWWFRWRSHVMLTRPSASGGVSHVSPIMTD